MWTTLDTSCSGILLCQETSGAVGVTYLAGDAKRETHVQVFGVNHAVCSGDVTGSTVELFGNTEDCVLGCGGIDEGGAVQ